MELEDGLLLFVVISNELLGFMLQVLVAEGLLPPLAAHLALETFA